ncbi:MAG: universal stress protein [Thermoanaerobaculia bacterium]|nr:universal stress protein [Thermoanaerobaculia bacterium]MBP9824404.1 universal stress protein [Thermoanaerobaculia bacterium]
MYKKILVTLENSRTDEAILRHIELLAQPLGSRLLLVHVADGWMARHRDRLNLAESEEMRIDRAYLESVRARFESAGIPAETQLLWGEPADEIVKVAESTGVDLIAMSTHGHRFLADLVYGSTANKVRHTVNIPVLLLKAPADL